MLENQRLFDTVKLMEAQFDQNCMKFYIKIIKSMEYKFNLFLN
jgi:hypothetical protein